MLSSHEAIAGKVAVGIPWLLLDTLSARLATGFMPRHPAVNIRLVGGVSTQLQHMLQAGDLDVALFFDRKATAGPTLKPLFSERLLLAGDRSRDYRLDRPLPFSHLAGVSLALPDASESFRQHLAALTKERGIVLDVRFEVGALQALRTLAANGLAHVFVSLHAVRADLEAGKLSAAPVDDPPIVRTLMLGLPGGRKPSRAARHLADVLGEEIAALVAAGSFLIAD
jgi:DNA-binding transcriptional LysR family regulator